MDELLQAAKQGDMEAQYRLGNRYYIGLGVEQNFIEAEHWLKEAAQNGHTGARLYLGILYKYAALY